MNLYRFTFVAMACECELQLWGEGSAVYAAADAAIADVRRIEAKYSRYRADSVTSVINRAAGHAPVAIDAETAALLDYAGVCHALSEGAFDITSGVLRRAWDFKRTPPRLPDAAEIAEHLTLVNWRAVERTEHTVFLRTRGMEIDFGGIGKEYAADRAATCCIERGVHHGLVNLGGDVRLVGPQPGDAPWAIGIRHPRGEGALATIELRAGALATSGDYERYFEIDGVRYCHLLDARTGMAVSAWQSVSVVASVCTIAGSCATIAMLQGDGAPAFLAAQGVDYVAIDRDGRMSGTLAATART